MFAGIRIAYWTPRASSASSIAGRATAASAWNDALALGLLAVDLGHEQVLQSSALETLPGRSFAATQSPGSVNRNGGWSQTDSKCPLEAPPSCSHAPGSRSNPCRARCGRLGRTSPPVRSGRGSPPSIHRGCRHGSAARSLPGPGGQSRCPALPRDHGQRRVHGADPGNGCSILVNLASRRQRVGRLFVVRTDDGLIVKRSSAPAGTTQAPGSSSARMPTSTSGPIGPGRPTSSSSARSRGQVGRTDVRLRRPRTGPRITGEHRAARRNDVRGGPAHQDHHTQRTTSRGVHPLTTRSQTRRSQRSHAWRTISPKERQRANGTGDRACQEVTEPITRVRTTPGEENREETCRDSL